jgi:hypothetical protein
MQIKLGRPKGSKQKRNEAKYWLPPGVTLANNNPSDYLKSTKLYFIDDKYGVFMSTFKAIQDANASTHPEAINERRAKTNLEKYGCTNPGANKDIRNKINQTMVKKYGVENALQNSDLLKKSKDTLFKNYGVQNMMHHPDIVKKIEQTSLAKYGTTHPMKNIGVQVKQFYAYQENKNRFISSGEKEVGKFIESLGLEHRPKFIYDKDKKRQIDIFIPSLNIAIEYNGLYWHSEANPKIYPKYHYEKYKMCKDQGIRLIQIFEHEWIEKNKQVKSFLKSALGKNERIVYARKCTLKQVDKKEAAKFLEEYHIQGSPGFNASFGLYYNDELLCLASFGKHHRNSKDWVLSRFVGKEGVNVVGGLSKIVKEALKHYKELSTWVDLRLSNGDNWIKCGWSLNQILKPDYFYFDNKTGNIVKKQSRQKKSVNTPAGMTEHEHALLEKLYRIYDAGKLKLIIK